MKNPNTIINMTGLVFGDLTVIKKMPSRKGATYWLCECKCGNTREAYGRHLRIGMVSCCGCTKGRPGMFKKHGKCYSSEYAAWHQIKQRCTKPKDSHYPDYGGRGIRMCERWLYSFINFFEDMGTKPTSKHSIDRIDNDGNYEPSNCRWATKKVQNRNKRSNTMVTMLNGITISMAEAAELSRLSYWAIQKRYKKYGNLSEKLFAPVKKRKSKKVLINN